MWSILLPLLACTPEPDDTELPAVVVDADGDGATEEVDCDDTDASVFPGAVDAPYDGIDADCSGGSDYDADGDGVDSDEHGGEDCDDADADISPDAAEGCDGVDNNCDGLADEAGDDLTWWTDGDGDGYGDSDTEEQGCVRPDGVVDAGGDCDDANPLVNPGVAEVACNGIDDNCDRSYGDALATPDGVEWLGLQEAVDGLAATGGTLNLCEGTFPAVTIAVDAPLHLIGSELGSKIHAGFASSAVRVTSGEVTLQGLELTGGGGTLGESGETYGGGLLVDSADPVHVVNCEIDNNQADHGAGIYLARGASVTLTDTSLIDNTATEGAGVYGVGDNTLTLSGAYISDNEAESGAGILLGSGATATADASTKVTDNHANGRGGGISLAGDSRWTGGEVNGNTASDGAGLAITCAEGEDVALAQIFIVDNLAMVSDGGGLALACSVTAEELTIYDNSATVAGGAFSVEGAEHVVFTACTITENNARDPGRAGGAQVDEGVLESIGTDWGQGGDDNGPVDIRLGDDDAAVEYSYDGSATFVCTASGDRVCE